MVILTGEITHPSASSVVLSNAYIEVQNVSVREVQNQLIWTNKIWAVLADKDNGLPSIGNDSGNMTYDDEALVDTQLEAAMIVGTSGGAIDYSNCVPPA